VGGWGGSKNHWEREAWGNEPHHMKFTTVGRDQWVVSSGRRDDDDGDE
jgi:hypothetical protein